MGIPPENPMEKWLWHVEFLPGSVLIPGHGASHMRQPGLDLPTTTKGESTQHLPAFHPSKKRGKTGENLGKTWGRRGKTMENRFNAH